MLLFKLAGRCQCSLTRFTPLCKWLPNAGTPIERKKKKKARVPPVVFEATDADGVVDLNKRGP